MRAANLLTGDVRPRRRARLSRARLSVAAAAALLALAVTFVALEALSARDAVGSRRAALAAVQAQLDAVPAPKPLLGSALSGELAVRTNALALALSRRIAWDRVLREFALVLPSDIWLTGLSLHTPTPSTSSDTVPAAPGTAGGVTISGYGYSQAGVARMLARVAAVPYFTGVQLQTSAATRLVGGKPAVSFTIVADVRTPAGAAS